MTPDECFEPVDDLPAHQRKKSGKYDELFLRLKGFPNQWVCVGKFEDSRAAGLLTAKYRSAIQNLKLPIKIAIRQNKVHLMWEQP